MVDACISLVIKGVWLDQGARTIIHIVGKLETYNFSHSRGHRFDKSNV